MTIKRALHTRILAAASLVVLLALALAPVRARAADAIDPTQTGSLTVVCEHEGVKLRNVRVNIWRVAELSTTGHATLVDPFDAYSVSLDQDDTVGWSGAAYTLAGYAARDEISPTASQSSNSEGVATFGGLILTSSQDGAAVLDLTEVSSGSSLVGAVAEGSSQKSVRIPGSAYFYNEESGEVRPLGAPQSLKVDGDAAVGVLPDGLIVHCHLIHDLLHCLIPAIRRDQEAF